MSTSIKIRWDHILAALALGIVLGAMGCWAIAIMPPQESAEVVNEHGGWPRCTDELADAGAICWGEPE